MPNIKIDKLMKNYSNSTMKQTHNISINELLSLIKEVEDTLPLLKTGRVSLSGPLTEESAQKSEGSARTISLSAIPEISVSELGWATLSTSDTGAQISSPQRTQLEQYLSNIGGTTFAEKIKSISDLFNMTDEQIQNASFLQGNTNSDKVQKTLAYLVFLKTLTTIVTNFNAASAGFSFEAFLAVLLGGKQIPASGAKTIADLHAGDGTPLSLKLYAEQSLNVGGSFNDLVGDMVNPKTSVDLMRYIIATKDLSGEGLDRVGSVKIYQFDITLENFFNVMMVSDRNSKLIRLPQQFIENPESFDASKLAKQAAIELDQEQVEKIFLDTLKQELNDEIAQLIYSSIKENSDEIIAFSKKAPNNKLGYSQVTPRFINDVIFPDIISKSQTQLNNQQKQEIKAKINIASNKTIEFVNSKTGQAGARLKDIERASLVFADPKVSFETYNSMSNDLKKKALLNTYGYLNQEQFETTRTQVFKIIDQQQGSSDPIGTIQIGAKNLQDTINKLASNLNDTIFDIFSSLSVLTTNINTYFATGLRDETAADQAQTAAQNIDKKTEEIKKART